jgi:hypothetical protein
MNYTSLVTDIQAWTQRGNATADATVTAQIPRIINRAEITLARRLKIPGFQSTVTSTMTASSSGVVAKPADWLDTISMNFGTGTSYLTRKPLLPRSYEYSLVYWPNRTTYDEPEYYADYDEEHWLLFPSPNLAYPFEVLYHATPKLLDSSNQTNYLTEEVPDLLLYECLVAAGPFCGWNADKRASIKELRDDAQSAVSMQDLLRIIDRGTKRRGS